MDIKPYEISIWRDNLNTINGRYEEEKIAIIGSDSMTADCRAISPKLTKNVNGSITLEFTLYTHYFDIELGDYTENQFIKLLNNETKIKIKYDNEWFDFVVKNINESSDAKSYTYTCEALFINELAKNGFGLVFSNELENSTGTIEDLVSATLEGTDWIIDSESSELIQQTNEEPLYTVILNSNSLTAKYKVFTGHSYEEETVTVPGLSTIYVPYSVILNRAPLFQFFWRSDDSYSIDENGIITNSECYYVENFDFNTFNTRFSTQLENLAISIYRGKRFIRSPKKVWDERFNQFMDVYTKGDEEYYGYTTTEYITTDVIFGVVTNPKDFESFDGWNITNPLNLGAEIYPSIMEDKTYNPNATSYLKVSYDNVANDKFYNSGFTDNRKRFIPTDTYVGGLTEGLKYVLDYEIYTGETPSIVAAPEVFVATYHTENTDIVVDTKLMTFDPTNTTTEYYRVQVDEDNYEPDIYYIYDVTTKDFILDTSEEFDVNKLYYNQKAFIVSQIETALSYNDMLSKKIGIFIDFDETGIYWIKSMDVYQYQKGNYGDIITTDPIAIQGFYQVHYFYYNVVDNIDKKIKEDIKSYESVGPDESYIQQYDENYTKRRAYENQESNRFNIIQDLCELFECWAEFKINHNENGSISRDENGRLEKFIIIKNFIGKDNFAGFRYGINLKDIRRDLDSEDLVSKIIVKDNSNEFGIDGYCSIERANENPCGERFLYDFRHYYNTGLLNYAEVMNDFYVYTPSYTEVGYLTYEEFNEAPYNTYYIQETFQYKPAKFWSSDTIYYIDEGSSTGWLGYYKRMREINADRTEIIEKQSILYKTIINLESSLSVYENLKDESAKEFNKIINTQIDVFCEPFTYSDYIADSEAELYWKLGILSQTIFNAYATESRPFYIYNGTTYEPTYNWVSNTIYYAGKDSGYIEEQSLLGAFEARTYGAMLDSIKTDSKMAEYLMSAQIAEKKASHGTKMYDEYYSALYGKGETPEDDGYIEGAQREYDRYSRYIEDIKAKKEVLNALFYAKYSRFIQEGSWTDDNYMDDNLYYYDALSTLATSAQPKVSYTINVIEVSELEDLHGYKFDVGDKTYMEDIEFFGWIIREGVKSPYQEEVIISEVTWNLNSPENNTIKVQNYKTRFEDLFQRITATTASLEFAEGSYARAAAVVNTNGTINADSLQASFSQNAITLSNAKAQSVIWDDTGITISTPTDPNHMVRIINQGIYLYNGDTWNLGITGDGINADYINVGLLDTQKIRIMNSGWATFLWDTNGISAYAFTKAGEGINVSIDKYVRFDQYGIYGINGKVNFIPEGLDDIVNNAAFGLTWNGFFLNSDHGDKRVRISSNDDIQVLVPPVNSNSNDLIERVKLGKIYTKDNIDYYGLLLRNNNGDVTLYTSDEGNLWLSNSITIAAEDDENPIVNIGYLSTTRSDTTYHEVIHAGNTNDKEFIVYEDGYIKASAGQIGNVTISEISTAISDVGYSITIESSLGTALVNKAKPILSCHVFHDNVEIQTGSVYTITYQWYLDDVAMVGATQAFYSVTDADWTGTDILKYSCAVTITKNEE